MSDKVTTIGKYRAIARRKTQAGREKIIVNEIEQQRDAKFFPGAQCQNCYHSYQVRLNPTDLQSMLTCMQGPPAVQLVQLNLGKGQVGEGARIVPRIVAPSHFCHAWLSLADGKALSGRAGSKKE